MIFKWEIAKKLILTEVALVRFKLYYFFTSKTTSLRIKWLGMSHLNNVLDNITKILPVVNQYEISFSEDNEDLIALKMDFP